jgi:pentatricopeptide repeat protein
MSSTNSMSFTPRVPGYTAETKARLEEPLFEDLAALPSFTRIQTSRDGLAAPSLVLPRGWLSDLSIRLILVVLTTSLFAALSYLMDDLPSPVCTEVSSDEHLATDRLYFYGEILTVALCIVLPGILMQLRVGRPAKTSEVSSRCMDSESPSSKACVDLATDSPAERHPKNNLAHWNKSIHEAAKTGDIAKAEETLDEIESSGLRPDVISFNSVLHAHAKKGDLENVERLLERMRDRSVRPNAMSYNITMDASTKATDSKSPDKWLTNILEKGIEAGEISFKTVVQARAQKGETASAEQWLRKMIGSGVEPDAAVFNSVIQACSRRGHVACAERCIETMAGLGIAPQPITFAAILDTCANAGDADRAEKWMQKLCSESTVPDIYHYRAMIDACSKALDIRRAKIWHSCMSRLGMPPDAHCLEALLKMCAKVGDADSACTWLAELTSCSLHANVDHCNAALEACAKASDVQLARKTFDNMCKYAIHPTTLSYALLGRTYAHHGDWQEVEELMKQLENKGYGMDEQVLYALMLAYANSRPRQADRADTALQMALKKGVKVNKFVHTAATRAIGRQRCQQVMEEYGVACTLTKYPTGGRY